MTKKDIKPHQKKIIAQGKKRRKGSFSVEKDFGKKVDDIIASRKNFLKVYVPGKGKSKGKSFKVHREEFQPHIHPIPGAIRLGRSLPESILGISATPEKEMISKLLRKVKPVLISWDFKEQPDWKEINRAITKFQNKGVRVNIIQVNTYNDDFAIVIGDLTVTQEQADDLYAKE